MRKYLSVILFLVLSSIVIVEECAADDISEDDDFAAVYGSVVDAASGFPVANAAVRLYEGSSGLHSLGRVVGSSITGSDGNFSFTDIVVKDGMLGHSVVVSCAGYKSGYTDVRLAVGKNTEIQVLIVPES